MAVRSRAACAACRPLSFTSMPSRIGCSQAREQALPAEDADSPRASGEAGVESADGARPASAPSTGDAGRSQDAGPVREEGEGRDADGGDDDDGEEGWGPARAGDAGADDSEEDGDEEEEAQPRTTAYSLRLPVSHEAMLKGHTRVRAPARSDVAVRPSCDRLPAPPRLRRARESPTCRWTRRARE